MNEERPAHDYGVTGQFKFVDGPGGFSYVDIENRNARALISVYAGQVLSYQPAGAEHDLLFRSAAAFYAPGKAIKGGVPVCWPWFGPDPEGRGRAAHGFVRNRTWSVSGIEMLSDDDTKLVLSLADSEETRAIWPHAFNLDLEITVGKTLKLELVTRNTGDTAFTITQALHAYFNIGEISKTRLLGLDGKTYIDKVDKGSAKNQRGDVVVNGEVDRIYAGVNNDLVIDDAVYGRKINIASSGSKTTVVWNPWVEISKSSADLQDDDYKRFICVETANAGKEHVQVEPGTENRLQANYRVERA